MSVHIFPLIQTKVLAEKAFILITKVGDSMLSSREVDDEPVEVETKAIFMRLERQTPGSISDKPAKIKDSKVTFPPSEELLGPQAQETKYVDTQVRIYNGKGVRYTDEKMKSQTDKQKPLLEYRKLTHD